MCIKLLKNCIFSIPYNNYINVHACNDMMYNNNYYVVQCLCTCILDYIYNIIIDSNQCNIMHMAHMYAYGIGNVYVHRT